MRPSKRFDSGSSFEVKATRPSGVRPSKRLDSSFDVEAGMSSDDEASMTFGVTTVDGAKLRMLLPDGVDVIQQRKHFS